MDINYEDIEMIKGTGLRYYPGWVKIIKTTFKKAKELGAGSIRAVSEYGELKFNFSNSSPELEELKENARKESLNICCECGNSPVKEFVFNDVKFRLCKECGAARQEKHDKIEAGFDSEISIFELIKIASKALTPDTDKLFNYIIWSSDNNGGFLRTCYRRKSNMLINFDIRFDNYTVVAFEREFDESKLEFGPMFEGNSTQAKLEFHFANDVDCSLSWDLNCGYPHCYIIHDGVAIKAENAASEYTYPQEVRFTSPSGIERLYTYPDERDQERIKFSSEDAFLDYYFNRKRDSYYEIREIVDELVKQEKQKKGGERNGEITS